MSNDFKTSRSEVRRIPIDSLRLGPRIRSRLSDDQEARIRRIFDLTSDAINMSLDEVRDGFLRDAHPEQEIEVWEAIAKTYQTYRSSDRQLNAKIMAAILETSFG
jgi:hypothetical protein